MFFGFPSGELQMTSEQSTARQVYFEQVWHFVRQVPYGKVVTYGQIAQALPHTENLEFGEKMVSPSQLVGGAMAACPEDVPWHRVINSQGKVSNRPDMDRQQQLLKAEGVQFYQGRLSLNEYQWHGDEHVKKPIQHSLF